MSIIVTIIIICSMLFIYVHIIYILHIHTCDAVKNRKDNHYIEEVAKKVAEAMSEFGEVYN